MHWKDNPINTKVTKMYQHIEGKPECHQNNHKILITIFKSLWLSTPLTLSVPDEFKIISEMHLEHYIGYQHIITNETYLLKSS